MFNQKVCLDGWQVAETKHGCLTLKYDPQQWSWGKDLIILSCTGFDGWRWLGNGVGMLGDVWLMLHWCLHNVGDQLICHGAVTCSANTGMSLVTHLPCYITDFCYEETTILSKIYHLYKFMENSTLYYRICLHKNYNNLCLWYLDIYIIYSIFCFVPSLFVCDETSVVTIVLRDQETPLLFSSLLSLDCQCGQIFACVACHTEQELRNGRNNQEICLLWKYFGEEILFSHKPDVGPFS